MVRDFQQFDLFGKKTFEKAVIAPPARYMGNMPNEACFYYLITGCANIYSNKEKLQLMTEEGLVLNCGTYLNEFLANNDIDYCEAIAIHLNPEIIKMVYDKEFPDFLLSVNQIKPVKYARLAASTLLKNYIENLQFYFENPALVSEELLKLKIKELILLLAKTDNVAMLQSLVSGVYSQVEVDFKEAIEANIYNRLSLEELAGLTNLSLSSFKREFVKHYGVSPAKYIRQRKLEQAAKLLKGTDLRVSDIAFDCGFTELAHFSRSFQKAYGQAPSNYRLS